VSAGIGVMIGMLCGNESTVAAYHASMGKTIAAVIVADDALRVTFDDESTLIAKDDGQSCCEVRYMRTDDDLAYFVGAKLVGIEIKEAPSESDEYGEHEVQFLEVQTDRGVFTLASHNKHNGYYGGFWITLTLEPAAKADGREP